MQTDSIAEGNVPYVVLRQPAALVFDRACRIVWYSEPASNLFDRASMHGTPLQHWFSDISGPRFPCPCGPEEPCVGRARWRGAAADGFEVEVELSRLEGCGEHCCVAVLSRPDSARQASNDIRILAQAVAQTDDAVVITDAKGIIQYVNPAFERGSGYSAAEAVGNRPNLVKSGRHPQEFFGEMWRVIQSGQVFRAVFANRRKNGRIYYEEKTISPIRDESGAISHYVSTAKDVTARVQAEARLEYLANYDTLTGLANRSLFRDRLDQALRRALRDGSTLAVLFLDLDRFKTVNDTLGHTAGDQLLRAVAERLRDCIRAEDTAARLGGDEFTLILEDLGEPGSARRVAEGVLESFNAPFPLLGHNLYMGVSIGIACYPDDGLDADTLLKHADIAMYRSKEGGRSAYLFYSASMRGPALDDLSLASSLRNALAREEFHLCYQTIVDAQTRREVGVEALLRWTSPQHGSVPPSRFVPMLEENGLILRVGRWVLATACADIGRLHGEGRNDLRLTVNVSARQFRDTDFVADVEAALQSTGFPAASLELEITESALIENAGAALETLAALDALGVRLAIDDFGTGYSSLSYLRRFPLSTLKIDRSFVADMANSDDAIAIVQAIVSLGRTLGLEIVGEGVESEDQLELLGDLGCHCVQGFLFSRPQPLEQLSRVA